MCKTFKARSTRPPESAARAHECFFELGQGAVTDSVACPYLDKMLRVKPKVLVLRVLFHTACTHKEQGSRTVQDSEQVVVPNSRIWIRQRSDTRITIVGSFSTLRASLSSPLHSNKTIKAIVEHSSVRPFTEMAQHFIHVRACKPVVQSPTLDRACDRIRDCALTELNNSLVVFLAKLPID